MQFDRLSVGGSSAPRGFWSAGNDKSQEEDACRILIGWL